MEDWTLKIYHVFYGPLLWKRGPVPPRPEGMDVQIVKDYYAGNRTEEEIEQIRGANGINHVDSNDNRSDSPSDDLEKGGIATAISVPQPSEQPVRENPNLGEDPSKFNTINGHTIKILIKPRNWGRLLWICFTHGLTQDVISQQGGNESFLAKNVSDMHARAKKYDLKTEHLFSLLQGLTAGTASFAHGANDISNAAGPLSTIYLVWSTNTSGSKAPVPVWVLCYTAAALCIGLWTYGYHLMRNLGNRLTLQSPSRGFTMELGAAITVVFATRLSLPVSTTQCLIGAVVFVGLCNGDIKAVNWRMVLWSYCGWFLTVPCAGLIAGIIMGIIVNAPQIGAQYVME